MQQFFLTSRRKLYLWNIIHIYCEIQKTWVFCQHGGVSKESAHPFEDNTSQDEAQGPFPKRHTPNISWSFQADKSPCYLLQSPPLCLTVAMSNPGQWDSEVPCLLTPFEPSFILEKKWQLRKCQKATHLFSLSGWISLHYRGQSIFAPYLGTFTVPIPLQIFSQDLHCLWRPLYRSSPL